MGREGCSSQNAWLALQQVDKKMSLVAGEEKQFLRILASNEVAVLKSHPDTKTKEAFQKD